MAIQKLTIYKLKNAFIVEEPEQVGEIINLDESCHVVTKLGYLSYHYDNDNSLLQLIQALFTEEPQPKTP